MELVLGLVTPVLSPRSVSTAYGMIYILLILYGSNMLLIMIMSMYTYSYLLLPWAVNPLGAVLLS